MPLTPVSPRTVYFSIGIGVLIFVGVIYCCFKDSIHTALRFVWTWVIRPLGLTLYTVIYLPLFYTLKYLVVGLCSCSHASFDSFDFAYHPWRKMPTE